MTATTKFLLLRRNRFKDLLAKLVGAAGADEVLEALENNSAITEVVELEPDDRLVKFNDVKYALNKTLRV